jgi:hypothetical protein
MGSMSGSVTLGPLLPNLPNWNQEAPSVGNLPQIADVAAGALLVYRPAFVSALERLCRQR